MKIMSKGHPFWNRGGLAAGLLLVAVCSIVPTSVQGADVPVKTGLSLWLDASDSSTMTLDGSTVNEWRDKMGGSTKMTVANGTPTLVASGIGGVPTVHFDTSSWMADGVDHAAPVTIFFVSRQTGGSNQRVLGAANGNWLMGYWGGYRDIFYFNDAYNLWTGGATASDTVPQLYAATFPVSGTAEVYVSGVLFDTINGATGPNSLQLNGYVGGNEQSDCDISEVLVYDRILDSTDLDLVGGYLSWKYGLTTSYTPWTPSAVQWAFPGVSNITTSSAMGYANLAVIGAADADVTLYWGTSDAGSTNTGWTGTNYIGTVSTGLVEGVVLSNLVADTTYYFRFYGTNSAVTSEYYSAAVQFRSMAADEWSGVASRLWGDLANWVSGSVPDTAGESARFKGYGTGDVDLNGSSYSLGAINFNAGTYNIVDTNASPGTLTASTLTNTAGANSIQAPMTVSGVADVKGGTLTLSKTDAFSAGQLKLNGGNLTVQGTTSFVNGLNAALYYHTTGDYDPAIRFHNANSVLNEVPVLTKTDTGLGNSNGPGINYNGDFHTSLFVGMTNPLEPGRDTDHFIVAWTGYFTAQTTGDHYFQSYWADDAYSTYVDVNEDGVFQNTEAFNGNWGGTQPQTLTAGHRYKVAFGFGEWEGGENVGFQFWCPTIGDWRNVDPSSGEQAGMWSCESHGPVSMTGTPVNVASNGTITAVAGTNDAAMGALTVSNAVTMTTSGSTIRFDSATIPASATAVGFTAGADVYLTQSSGLDASGASVTITKAGSGNLILDRAGSNLGSATFAVMAGKLGAVDSGAFGGATLSLRGGGITLSSPGGDQTYAKAISLTANSSLVAGKIGGGVTGSGGSPVAELSGNVDLGGQILSASSTDDYTLKLSGQIQNGGTLLLTGGTLDLIDDNFDNLEMTGGSLVLHGGLTVSSLVQSGGSFSGLTGDLTVASTLTLSGGSIDMSGKNLVVTSATVTLDNGASLTYDQALTAGSIDIKNGTALNIGGNALNAGTLYLRNGGSLTCGDITASGEVHFWPQRTIANKIKGAGAVFIGEPEDSWGYVALTAANEYTGKTQIRLGKLRATDGVGLPTGSRIVFNNGYPDWPCVLQTSGTITRNTGTNPGEISWQDWGGGFASFGGPLTITLEGNATLSWSDSNVGLNNAGSLQLGSEDSTDITELTNPINLNNDAERHISVVNNPNSRNDFVRLSGVISGSGSWNGSSLRLTRADWSGNNYRNGLLEMTAPNTYTQRTAIEGVTLAADDGTGIPANSIVLFRSPDWANVESIWLTSGTLNRNIGSENEAQGTVTWWWGHGGFAARGGALAVNFPNAADPLDWGSNNRGFNGQVLQLNSQYADSKVTIANNINIGGGDRTVMVFDNLNTDQDVAELAGVLSGSNAGAWLWKGGPGTLWLTGANTMLQGIGFRDGENGPGVIRAEIGVGLPTNAKIGFWPWYARNNRPQGVLESKGTLTRTIGNGAGQVAWYDWDRDGGFAAYGGKFTVDINNGSELSWNDGATYQYRARLVLGSWSANDEVEFKTPLNLNNQWHYFKVWDNTNSATDRTTMSGNIRNGYFRLYGNGTLRMTGTNDLVQTAIQDTSTLLVNGVHTSTQWIWTENGHAAGLGGSGSLTVPNVEIRNLGRLSPGDRAVGTLTTAVSSGNGLFMQNGSTYEWELGSSSCDTVAQTGNLRLDSGWKLKLVNAGGKPTATTQYNLFTYTGSFSGSVTPSSIDVSEVTSVWKTAGMQVLQDSGSSPKRIYITGLASSVSMVNSAPTGVGETGGTTHGVISCPGAAYDVYVFWGTTNGGTNSASWDTGTALVTNASDVVDVPVSYAINPGAGTWWYTYMASNTTEQVWATPSTNFITLSPPAVNNSAGAVPAIGGATLRGELTAGGMADIYVCWGPTDGGTDSWDNVILLVDTPQGSFSTNVTGVYFGQTNYYRCFASNGGGTAWAPASSNFLTLYDATKAATITNNAATSITAHTAQLNGTLTCTDAVYNVYAKFGPADGAWTHTQYVGSYTNVTTPTAIAYTATGLPGGETTYFTLAAVNASRTVTASPSKNFVTPFDPAAFARMMQISFTNYAGSTTLTNFPALVRFNAANSFYSDFTSTNGYDLRFADLGGNALNFEYDKWNPAGESTVWVQIPLFTNNTTIVAYWGSASLTTPPACATNGAVWSAGFSGVWHMNERDIRDSTAAHNNGTAQNDVTTAEGDIGSSQTFDGNGDRINMGNKAAFIQTGDVTLSAWVRPVGTGSRGILVKWGNNYIFRLDGTRQPSLHINGWQTDNDQLPENQWSLVAWVHNNTPTRTEKCYINGVETYSNTANSHSGTSGDLQIGSWGDGSWFNGRIDEARIENVLRTPDWLRACYSNQVVGSTFVSFGPVIPVPGIANGSVSGIGSSSATVGATLYVVGTNYDAIVYWGQTDGGTNEESWANTNVVANYDNTGLTNISYTITSGLSEFGVNYYTWRVTNSGGYSAWAQPSKSWTAQREWIGSSDDFWATAANWAGSNVPDNVAESTLFAGSGAGNVDLNGISYTNVSMTFTAGNYSIIDTNASPGSLREGSLLNSGGANTIAVGMTVTGTTEISGGKLTLADSDNFSASAINLSSGTLGLNGKTGMSSGTFTLSFESGDLTGWTVIDTSYGDNAIFRGGGQPINVSRGNPPPTGSWFVRTYNRTGAGDSDYYTGILQSPSFIIQSAGTITFRISMGNFAWSGTPASPGQMAGVSLERETTPGVWDKVQYATGNNDWTWRSVSWDTTPYVGQTVRIRIYDTTTAGWGHTGADEFVITGAAKISTLAINLTNAPVNVTGNSSIEANSDFSATLGSLTITNNSTLTISGNATLLGVGSTIIARTQTAVGFSPAIDTYLTQTSGLEGSSASVTITKAGSGSLILNKAGNNLGSATFNVQAGKLVAVNVNAFGAGALQLNGGELVLSSPGGDVVYAKSATVLQNSILTAGKAGDGVNGPVTVTVSGNIDIASTKTLVAQSTNSYTLLLGGQITGTGTLCVSNGTVQITDTAFDNLKVVGGTAVLNGSLTAKTLIQTGGSLSGLTGNLIIQDTLWVLNPGNTIDMSGKTLDVSTADLTIDHDTTLTYDNLLTARNVTFIDNNAVLNITGGHGLTASQAVTVPYNSTMNLSGPLSVASLSMKGQMTVTGTITGSSELRFWPRDNIGRTVANKLSGSCDVYIGDAQDGYGYLEFTAANDYTGKTQIGGAKLRAAEGVGLPAGSRLAFNNTSPDWPCVWQTSGTITRNIGTNPGEITWQGGWGGGFASFGGPLTVSLEGNAALSWSDANVGFNNAGILQLGSEDSTNVTELTNPINLDAGERHISVVNNPDSVNDFVLLSGVISGNGGWSGTQLRLNRADWSGNNYRNGLLLMTATNTYTQRTAIEGVTLAASNGVGIPANSIVLFRSPDDGNVESIWLTSGTLNRNIGSDSEAQGTVTWWWGPGGFAARGGALDVSFPNAASPLDWGSNNRGFNGQTLQLNSRYADSMVTISNDINIGGGGRTITVFDNPSSDQDIGRLAGVLSGSNAGDWLYKRNDGTLWLSAANTMAQGIAFPDDGNGGDGVVRADPGVGLPAASRIGFWSHTDRTTRPNSVIEGKGSISRTIGDGAGQIAWYDWDRCGGFAAYGGKLTVDIGGGSALTMGSITYLYRPRLVLGSWSANAEVEFMTPLNYNNEWNYVKVYDNINSATDSTLMSGNIWNGYLRVYGNGWLRMTGTNDLVQTAIQDTATLLVNGIHTSTDWIWTEAGNAAGLGGSGSLTVPNVEIRNLGRLAPGDRAVGTLTTAVSSGNGLYMQNGSTYEWELGPGSSDMVAQTGNLRLDSGWKVQLIGAGGTPLPGTEYNLFTYSGSCTFSAPTIVTNGMPADWVASGVTVVHDPIGKRVYLTGLYSLLSVANDQPADLTSISATLKGFVSAQADPLYVSVFWSTNDGGTSASAWLANGFMEEKGSYSDVVGQSVSHPVTGLNTNELWYYTMHATNASGSISLWATPSMSFRALGPPAVTNTGVGVFGLGTATLTGQYLDHNRGTITLCWGTSDGGTNNTSSWQNSSNIGHQASMSFSGLARHVLYGGSYYYRIYVTNAYGTAWSDPALSFTQSWSPGSLPVTNGLQCWFDAGKGTTTDGSGVTTWLDQSGNGHTASRNQGTMQIAASAVNGLPAVQFAGNAYATMSSSQYPREQYIVTKMNGGDWGAWMGSDQRSGYMWNQNGNCWDANIPSSVAKNGGTLSYPFYLGDDRNSQYMVLKITGNNNNSTPRTYYLGKTEGWVSLNNYMAEIIGFSSPLSIADEALVGGYLTAKYGITTSYAPVSIGSPSTLSNRQATNVTLSAGWMNAGLNCSNAIYDVYAFWGATDEGTNGGVWANTALVGTFSDGAFTVTKQATGVSGTTWYTFLASNSLNQVWAVPSTNFTVVATPVVDNGAGALTNVGSVVLQGNLTAGVQANVYIYWGRTDGGTTPGNWEHEILLADTAQGAFSNSATVGYGFSYFYTCRASNDAGEAWAPASTSFTMPVPPGGYTYTDGLRGSMFQTTPNDQTPMDLGGASYVQSFSRVFTGTKADTVLEMTQATEPHEIASKNIILYGAANSWSEFGGSPGEQFVAALSGTFFPPATGSYRFQWSQDDRGWLWIDQDFNGVFDVGESVGTYAWTGDGSATLTAGQPYNFMFFSQDHGGGDNLDFRYTVPGGSDTTVDPTTQPGQWRHADGFLPGEPAISNTPVADLGQSSATLKGAYSAHGFAADVYAYWGTTDGQDVAGNWQTNRFVGTFHDDATLSLAVSNLALTTRHYYRFMMTNAVTNLWAAPSGQFDTVGQPTVANGAATGISQTNATLGVNLTAGGKGVLRIYWGLTDGLTDPAAWQNTNDFGEMLMGTHTATVAVRAGAPYYYRAYATNEVGEDWADETATFQTAVPSVSLSVRPAGSFSPTNIAGCQAWYDASVGVTQAAGRVTVWADQSGNGHHAVPGGNNVTITNGVVNGRPAIKFRASWLDAQNNMVVHSTYMVFKSGRYSVDPGNPNLWGEDWSAPLGRQDGGGWMLRPGERNFWEANPPSMIAKNGIVTGDWSVWLDNVDQYMILKVDANTGNWNDNTGYRLGCNGGWSGGQLDVAEIVAFNRVLTPAEENQVGAYLAGKYGIATTYGMPENGGQAIVTATLSAPSVSNVTVNFSFAGDATKNTDYTSSSDSVIITNGTWSSAILLSSVDDADQEENESISVSIDSLVNATNGAPATASTAITSDDPQVTNEGGATAITENTATLNGILTMGDSALIKVFWGVSDPGMTFLGWDGTNVLGTNNEDVAFSNSITGLLANKTYYYRYYATNSSMLAQDWADTAASFVTTEPSVSINDVSITEGNSGTKDFTFTLTVSTLSDIDVSVNVATRDGLATTANSDYIATNATVTILANQPSATFTVKVVGDTVYEYPLFADEMFYVDLTSPAGCTIADNLGVGTIVNDDAVPAPITNYTWTPTSAGTYNWDNTGPQHNWGTWLGGAFPSNTGDTANMNIGLAGAQFVNLNRPIKVGTLNIGDTDSGYYGMTISNGTSGSLAFDASSGSALLSKAATANTATDTIAATITLSDPLIVSNAAVTGPIEITGAIGGNSLTKTGDGKLILSGSGNTLTSIAVNGGTLEGIAGAISANMVLSNNVSVVFRQDSVGNYTKVISGTGSLTKLGSGTLVMTTNQTYTGDTVVLSGTLKLAAVAAVPAAVAPQLRLDASAADSIVLSGSSVTSWNDISGNSRHAVPGNSPTYSGGIVNFAWGQWLRAPMVPGTLSSGFTMFIVGRRTGGTQTMVTRTSSNLPDPIDYYSGSYLVGSASVGWTDFAGTDPNNITTRSVLTMAASSAGFQQYLNGVEVINGPLNNPSQYNDGASYVYLGTREDNATWFTGNMEEILLYNGVLSSSDRMAVEDYLTAKWITDGGNGGLGSGRDILPTNTTLRISTGAKIELAGTTNTVAALYIDGLGQASGTWGATGSGATHIDDVDFMGSGLLVVTEDHSVAGMPQVSNGTGCEPAVVSAILNGRLVSDGGAMTTVLTYWGSTDGGTTAGAWEHAVTNESAPVGLFSNVVSNLWYGIRYYYRTYATNANGEAWASASTDFLALPPQQSTALPTNTQAWWKFDDSGNLGKDSGPNANDLVTASGTPAYSSSGKHGGCLYLDGSSTMNKGGSFPTGLPTGGSAFTVALWVKDDGSSASGGFLGWGNNGGNQCNNFRYDGNSRLDNYWYGNDWIQTVSPDPKDGTWRHIAVTWETSGAHIMYVDGVMAGSESRFGINAQAANFVLGKTTADVNFRGWMDDVLIANRAFTAQEITNLYNGVYSTGGMGTQLIITNVATTFVTNNAATVTGELFATNSVFDVYAYYGTVDGANNAGGLWQTNAYVGSYTNVNPASLTKTITGLTGGTDYYWTFRASNAATNMWAQPSKTFKTTGFPGTVGTVYMFQ